MQDEHVRRVAALFDSVATEYDQHVPFFTEFARQLVAWTDVRADETLIDIGTGRGAVARAAQRRGATVACLDLAPAMLSDTAGPAVLADARSLPVRPSTFDIAVGAFSIHLLPDPVDGLVEAGRSVRPGGRVVLAYGGSFASQRWDFWFETLAKYTPRGTLEPTLPPPGPMDDPVAAFTDAGLTNVRVHEATISMAVRSPEAFLAGEKAHGARSFFDRFEPGVLSEVGREVLGHLASMEADGGITLDRSAIFVEGTR